MTDSPFDRSSRTIRTPPPIPGTTAPPCPHTYEQDDTMEVVSTQEIQNWMSSIEQCLNEICSITTEGKLNMEQKLRISTLCRKVGHGTSQMAVQYQAIKRKAMHAQTSIGVLRDQRDVKHQLQEIKQSLETHKTSTVPSFADMLKKGTNKFIQPTNLSSVAIYPNDKQRSSADTKSLVQKIICPEQMKLHVRALRKTRNGGVVISTETKEDIEKIKKSQLITDAGLSIGEPRKRLPRVVVIGVPSSMTESEALTCIYNQNVADKLKDLDMETFLKSCRLSHKSGRKDAENCNFIFEVPAVIRKALISSDRLFINWSSCPVRDFTLVTRCFKCQQYGHAAKTCRENNYTCSHCGEQGHTVKECSKESEPRCATCLHFKKPSSHITGSADCPAKIQAEKRYINSVDYEGA